MSGLSEARGWCPNPIWKNQIFQKRAATKMAALFVFPAAENTGHFAGRSAFKRGPLEVCSLTSECVRLTSGCGRLGRSRNATPGNGVRFSAPAPNILNYAREAVAARRQSEKLEKHVRLVPLAPGGDRGRVAQACDCGLHDESSILSGHANFIGR